MITGKGPYRTSEQPAPLLSLEGLLKCRKELEEEISRLCSADSEIRAGLKLIGVSALITGMGVIAGPEAAMIASVAACRYASDHDPAEQTRLTGRLISFFRDVFEHNTTPYKRRLQSMIERTDINKEPFHDVPAEYRQPLILDYALTQYMLIEAGSEKSTVIQISPGLPEAAAGKALTRYRLDEVIAASRMLEDQNIETLLDRFLKAEDYEAACLLRSSTPYESAHRMITEKVNSKLDALLDTGTERQLYKAAQAFADFGNWTGLREAYQILVEGETYGAEYTALSIRPVTGEDESLRVSPGALMVLYDVLIDNNLTERAKEITPFLPEKERHYTELEILWAQYRQQKDSGIPEKKEAA